MNLTIVTPVYNDWESFKILLQKIDTALSGRFNFVNVIAVNDCSSDLFEKGESIPQRIKLTVLDLAINVGHQRAIIIGLCYTSQTAVENGFTVVMDSDGEDQPEEIENLLNAGINDSSKKIVFAGRHKRSEGLKFRILYVLYKWLFQGLTGRNIRFGNFSCLPNRLLPRIIHNSDFWNHYSASIIKSKMPYMSIPTRRGKRYSGTSKMNFNNLIVHGLSSLSLYLDVIIVRFLKVSFFALLLVLGSLSVILYIRYFTPLAIPGWASSVFTIIVNILVTISLFTFLVILQHLSSRSQNPVPPVKYYKDIILDTKIF